MQCLRFTFLFSFFVLCTLINFSLAMPNINSQQSISYTDSGQGKPIVLIHAFPTDKRLWKLQHQGLDQQFRVISLDLWGFGESLAADGKAITMETFADEVKQLLDQLRIEKAIIGGESMGGYIALAFLEHYPNRVDGLILSDTQSIADTAEVKAKREMLVLDVLAHGTTQFIHDFLDKALSKTASNQTRDFLQSILKEQSSLSLASALRGMALRKDTSSVLSMTTQPILIISGDEDILISPQQSYHMHDLAKNSRLIIINHAGHLSSLEQPNQWNQAVIDMFLH